MTQYARDLPHWHPQGKSLFVTWRLFGSLPVNVLRALGQKKISSGRRFVELDSFLDRAACGPHWLKDPRIARCVVDGLLRGEELAHYRLHAFVVMSNHVYALMDPKVPVAAAMDALKGATARRANQLLGRTGAHFWQDESFDHWVRNDAEFARIRAYIEGNPVSAGLAQRSEQWPWSSVVLRPREEAWVTGAS